MKFLTPITAVAPVYKRRLSLLFQPTAAADTAPDLTQAYRLPYGAGGAAVQWKMMSAILRVDNPNAAATTAQIYYASNPGNAAFGAGTAALSSAGASPAAAALSAAGTSTYEVSTTKFTGDLATTGLPSGSLVTRQFSALGGSIVSLEAEFEEV